MEQTGNKQRKTLSGEVVSIAMKDTIVVSVPVVNMHRIYKKRFTTYKKCYAHIDANQESLELGDKVTIVQIAPRSKTKKRLFVEKIV